MTDIARHFCSKYIYGYYMWIKVNRLIVYDSRLYMNSVCGSRSQYRRANTVVVINLEMNSF